ncbi:hypothetical protein KDC22_07035 [Paenibacillus tritici]|uniref:hypothetical protein n=1 Tax=Paenibacillus tritici TaxID=1873425 RepID=UPI001BA771CC|nr:hypothetical protein [Paenibacillus tritici]QUL56258.1 hypothetical protein KDC22_07035 [Paenibacillus tritici]
MSLNVKKISDKDVNLEIKGQGICIDDCEITVWKGKTSHGTSGCWSTTGYNNQYAGSFF